MNPNIWLKLIPVSFVVLVAWLLVLGNPQNPSETDISAIVKTMDPADSALVREQKFCAVRVADRLGTMGVPYKIEIKGTPLFLCCQGCKQKAFSSPERTLENLDHLRSPSRSISLDASGESNPLV